MLNNLFKIIVFFVVLLILIHTNFAQENVSGIYFNASSQNDGDGCLDNPYKYLDASKIKENSDIYFSDGEYELDNLVNIKNISFHGINSEKTIIKHDGLAFNIVGDVLFENITLKSITINNTSKLTLKNVIFDEGKGILVDNYNNTCGGAIYTEKNHINSVVSINNCTFINSHAEYGGAIYMGSGILNINETLFKNIYSYNYGGVIVCENAKAFISKSKFINTTSFNDAGGSIYIKSSTLIADNLNITNSSADFGGAITALKSTLSITNSYFSNNKAKYDGGVIYQFYGNIQCIYSKFINNSAKNGDALYVNNLSQIHLKSNEFSYNGNSNTSHVIYSILNNITTPLNESNTFYHNNPIYESYSINLIIKSQNYSLIKNNSSLTALPSYYSLIDEKQVTDVKNQGSTGNCWSFTAMAVLESCILKATNHYLDLSEENLKNLMAVYSDWGWDVETNIGGYYTMPLGYLTSWLGPVLEENDIFDDKSTLSPLLDSFLHVQNILFLKHENAEDNDEIKKAIIQYGAVGAGMAYYNNFFNNNTNSYYCFLNNPSNHAVTIVGWDDNYSKDNFKYSKYLKNDGAWIVKNSWGSEWADGGYFYVSYYDEKFAKDNPSYTIIFNDTIKYDKNYQYDIAGMTNYFLNLPFKVWYKNIFTSTEDEFLAAVSTYFEKTTNWTLTVKVNNQIKHIQNGISNAGYYTIKLNNLIPLKKNDVFEVIFNTSVSGKSSFPISEIKSLNKLTYASGMSYVSYNNRQWQDLSNFSYTFLKNSYTSQVACIKAFTILNPVNINISISFWQNKTIIKITDEFKNMINTGNVVVNIDGDEYVLEINDSHFEVFKVPKNFINLYCNAFEKNITIIFTDFTTDNQLYKSLDLTNLSNGVYHINITSSEYNGSEFKESENKMSKTQLLIFKEEDNSYKIKLTDEKNYGIYNRSIEIILNNKSYNLTTDINGFVNMCIDDDAVLEIIFRGDKDYFKSNISKHINVLKVNLNVNISHEITLINLNLTKNINETLKIKINDKYYNISLINGVASLKLSGLSNDVYSITVFADSPDYILLNNTFNFTVDFKQTYFVFNNQNLKNNQLFNLTAKLQDSDNNPITNSQVYFIINNKIYDLKTDDVGVASIELNLTCGSYDLSAYYNGFDKYLKTSCNFKINVENKELCESEITSSDLITYYKSNAIFTITLTDIWGNYLSNFDVEFKLNNKSYIKTTNIKGQAFINIDLKTGNYIINTSFKGSQNYLPSFKFNNIQVTSSIIVSTCNTFVYNFIYPVQFLNHEGKHLNNSKVYFILNNKSYLKTTDEKGYAYLTFNFTSKVCLLKIINLNNGEELIRKIQIIPPIIKNNDLTTYEYSKEYYKILILNNDGKPNHNTLINIKINDKNYQIKSNNQGYACLKINLAKGKYIITCQYKTFKVSNKLTVKPIITAKDITKKKSKSYRLSAKLNTGDYGKKITFKLKNKKYMTKTNKKGVAIVNVKLKLKKGVYKVHVSYVKSVCSFKLKIK